VTTRTALYRHFSADGALLYIGISLAVTKRLSDHVAHSHWSDDIARVEISWFPSRKEALAAEKAAIGKEKPKHNAHHNRGDGWTADGMPMFASRAIEYLGYGYACGPLPSGLADETQALMDKFQEAAFALADKVRADAS
jgi:predicted GIY-YIG superfamily endonuclease